MKKILVALSSLAIALAANFGIASAHPFRDSRLPDPAPRVDNAAPAAADNAVEAEDEQEANEAAEDEDDADEAEIDEDDVDEVEDENEDEDENEVEDEDDDDARIATTTTQEEHRDREEHHGDHHGGHDGHGDSDGHH